MPDFSAQSKFDATKGYTGVKFGADAPLLETEMNELQDIQNYLRAELTRQQINSGVLDFIAEKAGAFISSNDNHEKGKIYAPTNNQWNLNNFRAGVNGFRVGSFSANVAGNVFSPTHTAVTSPNNGYVAMEVPDPPTNGIREDLIFLEAWFEDVDYTKDPNIKDSRIGAETSRRRKLNWRIRSVAGVDFSKYPEGLGSPSSNAWAGHPKPSEVAPQGANAQPIVTTDQNSFGFAGVALRANTSLSSGRQNLNTDSGLYVAGAGDTNSKNILGTSDGYVYAIPLFRVKRRNSGGYREDNLNGAKNYFLFNPVQTYVITTGLDPAYNPQLTWDFVGDLSSQIKVGDIIRYNADDKIRFKVNSITVSSGKTTLGMTYLGTKSYANGVNVYFNQGSPWNNESDRPDGKFANIIDKDDIIDLRHKVSLTGVNYQQLLEQGFDSLLRGELTTRDSIKDVKERFGLIPAPKSTPVYLVPKKVKSDDGLDRFLVNSLGFIGDIKDAGNGAGYGWSKQGAVNYGSYSVLGNKQIINSLSTDVGTARYIMTKFNVKANRLYLFALNASNVGSTTTRFASLIRDTTDISQDKNRDVNINVGATSFIYQKFSFTSDKEITMYLYNMVSLGTVSSLGLDSIRVYEIDQATYDKIDVDPAFTGDSLAGKFPYVSSYPNIASNVLDLSKATYGDMRIDSATGSLISSTNGGYSDYIEISPSAKYFLSWEVNGFRANQLSHFAFYDANKTFISGGIDLSVTTVPSNAKYLRTSLPAQPELKNNVVLTKDNPYMSKFIPFGVWFLPDDYAQGLVNTRLADYNTHRRTFSDAQVTDVMTEFVEALKTPQKHISVTQATEGTWAIGDAIKVKSDNGVVSGVIDSDTALAKVIGFDSSRKVYILDTVAKLVDGDKFRLTFIDTGYTQSQDYYVKVVSTTNNEIQLHLTDQLAGALSTYETYLGSYLFENTASTSSPSVTATGIAGTWSGLGTREATYTLTTAPTDTKATIKLDYSVSYPAGKGIQNVPTEVTGVKVNGLNYKKSDTLTAKATFKGKVTGNTKENPHIAKRGASTVLSTPLNTGTAIEFEDFRYNDSSILDGSTFPSGGNAYTVGAIGQFMFSFNVVEMWEREFGRLPALTLSDKIAYIKANSSRMAATWVGNGGAANGSKAIFAVWQTDTNTWSGTNINHTSSNPTRLVFGFTQISNKIDDNGFVHFVAYTDPSDGVMPSVINTDYIDFDMETNAGEAGYDVFVPENPLPVKVTDVQFQREGVNLIPPFTDSAWSLHANAKVVSDYALKLSATALDQFSAVSIPALPSTTYTFVGNTDDSYEVYGYKEDKTTLTVITKTPTSAQMKDKVVYTITTDANTYYLSLRATNRVISSGDANYSNPMLVKGNSLPSVFLPGGEQIMRSRAKRKLDFAGKVVGDTFTNLNELKSRYGSNTNPNPLTDFTAVTDNTKYSALSKQDGTLVNFNTTTAGNYSQVLMEFDLSHLGLSMSELKKALKKITLLGVGYGMGDSSGVQTGGMRAMMYDNKIKDWYLWSSNSTTTPSSVGSNYAVPADTFDKWVNANQKIYVMFDAKNPASANYPSEVFLDYVKLDIELYDWVDNIHKNAVKIRKETKEVKFLFPPKSEVIGQTDSVELFYKTLPYQGLNIEGVKANHLKLLDFAYVTNAGTATADVTNVLSRLSTIKTVIDKLPLGSSIQEYNYQIKDVNKVVERVPYGLVTGGLNYIQTTYPTAYTMTTPSTRGFKHPRMTYSGKDWMYIGITVDPIHANKILMLPALGEMNGELVIVLLTTSVDTTGGAYFTGGNYTAQDIYKLQGRPTIKA